MFIEGINPDLYISDPSQLVPGTELWSVGQGGLTTVCEPYFIGTLVGVNCDETFYESFSYKNTSGPISSRSMTDHHIVPQTYNNWYVCDSEAKAQQLYEDMKAKWDADPSYEEARRLFSDHCDRIDRWNY